VGKIIKKDLDFLSRVVIIVLTFRNRRMTNSSLRLQKIIIEEENAMEREHSIHSYKGTAR